MSLVRSQLRRQTVCCHFDEGGHGRVHGGHVPRVPRSGYTPAFSPQVEWTILPLHPCRRASLPFGR